MKIVINLLIGLVCLIHCYIFWFEVFAWETKGRKVFRNFPKELFEKTKVFAANQGLYNGFLAMGLVWSFLIKDQVFSMNVALFFLSCVAIAGIFGSITAERKIFYVQALPALIAIALILFVGY